MQEENKNQIYSNEQDEIDEIERQFAMIDK